MSIKKVSVIVTSIFLFIYLGSISCEKNSNPLSEEDTQVIAGIDSIKILALGDSYTIGESVSENERWPNQLGDSLVMDGVNVKEVRIIARTGWTTADLINSINSQSFEYNYDLVGLLIGVNNQFQGRTIIEYENQFRQLLETAIALGDSSADRVFVLSLPDYSVTPRGSQFDDGITAQEIDNFNRINKQLSEQFGVKYFDITPLSRTASGRFDLVALDGLHFSGKMYTLWVDYILQDILNLLSN